MWYQNNDVSHDVTNLLGFGNGLHLFTVHVTYQHFVSKVFFRRISTSFYVTRQVLVFCYVELQAFGFYILDFVEEYSLN